MLERIDDTIAVHDLGRGFGSSPWVTYPPVVVSSPADLPRPMSAADNVASVSDNLGSTVDAEFALENAAAEALGVALEDLATDLAVGALHARKSRHILERLAVLLATPVEQRRRFASQTYASLGLEQVASEATTDMHWILTGTRPRARFYVAARKPDSAAVGANLARVIR